MLRRPPSTRQYRAMDDLFRLSGARKRDPEVEAWFAANEPLRVIVQPWFTLMRACGDDVREIMHDGAPTACIGDVAFAYVNAYKAHASIGFFHGATLPDPAHLLEGAGKRMRHVKLRTGVMVDEAALNALIIAAAEEVRRRVREA